MWEAHTHGRVVVTITPLVHNWVVQLASDAVYKDDDAFAHALHSGEIDRTSTASGIRPDAHSPYGPRRFTAAWQAASKPCRAALVGRPGVERQRRIAGQSRRIASIVAGVSPTTASHDPIAASTRSWMLPVPAAADHPRPHAARRRARLIARSARMPAWSTKITSGFVASTASAMHCRADSRTSPMSRGDIVGNTATNAVGRARSTASNARDAGDVAEMDAEHAVGLGHQAGHRRRATHRRRRTERLERLPGSSVRVPRAGRTGHDR